MTATTFVRGLNLSGMVVISIITCGMVMVAAIRMAGKMGMAGTFLHVLNEVSQVTDGWLKHPDERGKKIQESSKPKKHIGFSEST